MTTATAPGPLIGKGLTSDVFAWENGRVLKVFFDWMPRHKIEREFNLTRAIQQSGFPCPKVFDLIEIDGRAGIIFERIDGISMFRTLHAKPWRFPTAARELAALHARMHDIKAPAELPTQREQHQGWIESAKDLSPADLAAARATLARLPAGDSLCHGDFHPENILYSTRGPIVIDWITATRGDAVLDVARSSSLFLGAAIPAGTPLHMRLLIHFFRKALNKVYQDHYFKVRPGPRELIPTYEPLQKAALSAWRSMRVN
jgi:aminoglycoside phosphotransferase (APT) family kinase protein